MSEADIAWGYGVEVAEDAAATTFLELAEVKSVSLPDQQRDEHEATHMKSPNRTKEFRPGLLDPGECSVTMNWVEGSATDTLLIGMKASGNVRQIRVSFPGGTVWTFEGWLKSYVPPATVGEFQEITAAFRVTGSLSITGVGS
ncbi:phage tail tube protein [Rhodovulum sp. YEN HP10]|uniref:phage tail tube protein n=1 Tax=Rhodovulum sp. HP10 TaxID=3387397 RepID=UPI0039DF8351